MAADRRPIGYWLKHLDRLIEENFDRTLANEGLTRRHWQILNTLRAQPSTTAELAEAVAPFVVDDPGAVEQVLHDLTTRGWVRPAANDRLELTEDGATAQAALLEKVTRTRRQVLNGITDDEYRTVIDILRRMAANLEAEPV